MDGKAKAIVMDHFITRYIPCQRVAPDDRSIQNAPGSITTFHGTSRMNTAKTQRRRRGGRVEAVAVVVLLGFAVSFSTAFAEGPGRPESERIDEYFPSDMSDDEYRKRADRAKELASH